MDKLYINGKLSDRIDALKYRYRMATYDKNDDGYPIKACTAASIRTATNKELQICYLIEELIASTPGKECLLSEDAEKGLERILEPLERHRRLR
jgi:hypothetical protein